MHLSACWEDSISSFCSVLNKEMFFLMCVCVGKTKILTVEEQGKEQQVYKEPAIYITLQDQALQEVEVFSY